MKEREGGREVSPVATASVGAAKHIHLSKSRYLAGRQCLKRLWLTCHAPELAPEPDPATQTLFDAGTEIGEKARLLFPGGVLVEEAAYQHDEAVKRTRELVAGDAVPAIFEAAFEHDGVRIRVDVLERLGEGAWGVREVKSSTTVHDVHADDVAVQCHVLKGCGTSVPSVELVHVDKHYVRGEKGIDWQRYFTRGDITREVMARLRQVPQLLREFRRVLAFPEAPAIEPSRHCQSPYDCEFWEHCTRDKPRDWVFQLPRLQAKQLEALRRAGIESISEIPEGFRLTPVQARAHEVVKSGREFISPELGQVLAPFGPPAEYLDFETMNPAIPLYSGTRPYQRIPFQWSLHRVDDNGEVCHREFLAKGDGDPRWDLARALLEALEETKNPVIVYSSFESGVLSELGELFPDLAMRLRRARRRLRDLLSVVRAHVYHPGFHGSFSIKEVAGALNPGFGYDDLEAIADGSQASSAFASIAQGRLDGPEEERLRQGLLAYCRRDTQALLVLHWALLRRIEK